MNKRFLLFLTLHCAGWVMVNAQLIVRPIDRSSISRQTTHPSARTAMEPLSLPFWDDFSRSTDVPDTTLWEFGADVFINNTIGQNPPSINVATFDGAQGNGRPYQITEERPGPTDSLISRAINLGGIPSGQRGDIFISFFWQLRGFGEIPESIDSIRLQLLDADTVWHTVWKQRGGLENLDELFRYEEINIQAQETADRRFFHNNFKIKFQGFSTLRGIYDTWNIDYVYINRYRRPSQLGNPQNRTILDRAISKTAQPLFGNFYEVPIEHFRSSSTITQQIITLSNIDRSDIHPVQYSHVITNTNSGEVLASNLLVDGPLLLPGELDDYPGIDTTAIPMIAGDSVVIEAEFSFRTGDSRGIQEILTNGDTIVFEQANIQANDTLRETYLLQDHYAYDDGTAEFAVGINLDQGQLAVQFFLENPDTLTHIDIYFPTLPTTAGQPMDIVVWDALTEEDERARVSYIVEERNARNQFARIALNEGEILRDTFYIGFQQFTDDYVAIGLDRSNDRATDKIFVNTSREWEQNTEISGALMIRPVFGDADDLVLFSSRPDPRQIILYPNPAQHTVHIKGVYDRLEIFDLGGRLRKRAEFTPTVDLTDLPRGLYIVRVYHQQSVSTAKLMIE